MSRARVDQGAIQSHCNLCSVISLFIINYAKALTAIRVKSILDIGHSYFSSNEHIVVCDDFG